jgi:pheromone shutdown protein TraB
MPLGGRSGPVITLVGTGHVFDIGARVREEIRKRGPQVVAIELDPPRYHALRTKNRDRSKTPFVYRMLADFQTRVADQDGVEAGAEMLAAADEARALNVPLALIDKDAQQTFQRLIREMGFGEKLKLAGSALAGLFLPGKSIEKQVDEMQEDYAGYFDEMGKRFPTLKRVLLDERNEHMARALAEMSRTQERIVAVVGDGHVDGMAEILAKQGLALEVVRLKDLRAPAKPGSTATATISWSVPGEGPPPRE